jgi:hypothetical protein
VRFEILNKLGMKIAVFWFVAFSHKFTDVSVVFATSLARAVTTHRSKQLRNVGELLPDYKARYPRRPQWEHEVLTNYGNPFSYRPHLSTAVAQSLVTIHRQQTGCCCCCCCFCDWQPRRLLYPSVGKFLVLIVPEQLLCTVHSLRCYFSDLGIVKCVTGKIQK